MMRLPHSLDVRPEVQEGRLKSRTYDTLRRIVAKYLSGSSLVLFCAICLFSFAGCATTALRMPEESPVLTENESLEEPSPRTAKSEEVFEITEEYFENTYRKAEGFLRSAQDLFDTGLAREAVPYLDTALLTVLDSQVELSEFPKMRELYQKLFDLNARILKANPEALDIYLDNRWSHFNTKNYTVPIVFNNAVRHFIEEYQTASRGFIERSLKRSGKYMPMIKQELAKAALPEDLAYLVIIESGFSPQATSIARARGLWQFMPSTGRRYGLQMNYWVDERCDPEKSTRAAIRYMRDLYNEFTSWKLVLASYNSGENRIRKAVEQCGTTEFWDIASSDGIHNETKEYVPRFMAATVIAKFPEKFGFYIDYDDPVEYDEVTINGWLDLKQAADCAGTSYSDLKALNPELRHWCTPPIYSSYRLKIPKGRGDAFLASYERIQKRQRSSSRMVTHGIRNGETLSSIANRYGSSVKAIMSANDLRSTRIRAGQKLVIPVRGKRADEEKDVGAIHEAPSALTWSETIAHRVKAGDTLYAIALEYGSSVLAIKQANGLKSNRITAGQKLIVPILNPDKSKKD